MSNCVFCFPRASRFLFSQFNPISPKNPNAGKFEAIGKWSFDSRRKNLALPRVQPIRFRKNIPDCWIGLELIEGKNRQVRRMTLPLVIRH
jgi:hypothetical protein